MKRITAILLAGMLIAVVAGAGIVSAAAFENSRNDGFLGPVSRWANNMGYGGFGNCPFFGSYANDGVAGTNVELEVTTAEEALTIAEEETGHDIMEDNVYQMGRWWVFYYTDENDIVKQGRIDAYNGNVIEDFTGDETYQQYRQSGQSDRSIRGGGYGGGCYGGGGYRY
ncbi:hypothetical protein [Methanolobus halotolerans]|uniref:Peptidase propeptide and YPEB domain-containing protein n=1 Tax=Methanolobus halotolerans TaxID=2052935 RepID=A0A4E0Q662_9EURY|nr:hypothetical protein [Methanolobus halotolerans]TGC09486.1 hypothetical protein CUN85_06560 [Methanolobus halotolerans]